MNTKLITKAIAALAMTLSAAAANAGVITFDKASDLAAKGDITQTTKFDSYRSGRGEVTTLTAGTVIDGALSMGTTSVVTRPLSSPRTLLLDIAATAGSTVLNIAGEHNLFGFDMASTGTLAGPAVVGNFTLTTNLGAYTFSSELLQARSGFTFFGFAADAGEYFTSFAFEGTSNVGVTDLRLGTAEVESGEVPEPASMALLFTGLGLVGLTRRRKA